MGRASALPNFLGDEVWLHQVNLEKYWIEIKR